jgi:hypothetical protein
MRAAIIAADASHARRLEEAENSYRQAVGMATVAFEAAYREQAAAQSRKYREQTDSRCCKLPERRTPKDGCNIH